MLNILIYGAGTAGFQVLKLLQGKYPYNVVGFVDDSIEVFGKSVSGFPIYRPSQIEELNRCFGSLSIIIAIPSICQSDFNRISQSLLVSGVHVYTLPEVTKIRNGRVKLSHIAEYDVGAILGRQSSEVNREIMNQEIRGKTVLVSGGGGSIGSEICRQIVLLDASKIIIVDNSEYALYSIIESLNEILSHQRMSGQFLDSGQLEKSCDTQVVGKLISVTDYEGILEILNAERPHIVYHSAAYKHVPIVENNVISGLSNNVFGTVSLVRACIESSVEKFILISSDKAVRPTNVMGASKRVAEMVVGAVAKGCQIDLCNPKKLEIKTKFASVRFGNVLGSSGSVIPLFQKQIENGGPITITDERVTRYFMTLQEAAQLVVQAGSLTAQGNLFLLEMGNPIKIVDLAKRVISLNGCSIRDSENPKGDIEIVFIGLRPGEKLYEELSHSGELNPTSISKINIVEEPEYDRSLVQVILLNMQNAIEQRDVSGLIKILSQDAIGLHT